MGELKTKETTNSVMDFLTAIDHEVRRGDGLTLLKLYQEITGHEAKMWGTSIIGFGTYQYDNPKGETVTWMRSAFSVRKQYLSLYLMRGVAKHPQLLEKLGKHKNGKSCLNINKLADVDIEVLKQLIKADVALMDEAYPNK